MTINHPEWRVSRCLMGKLVHRSSDSEQEKLIWIKADGLFLVSISLQIVSVKNCSLQPVTERDAACVAVVVGSGRHMCRVIGCWWYWSDFTAMRPHFPPHELSSARCTYSSLGWKRSNSHSLFGCFALNDTKPPCEEPTAPPAGRSGHCGCTELGDKF